MLKVRDIMTQGIVTVSTKTTLWELEKIFVTQEISGAPVLDDNQGVVGYDLVAVLEKPRVVQIVSDYLSTVGPT